MKINSFCVNFSLRTGVILIGTLHLIIAIFSLISLIVFEFVSEEPKGPGLGLYFISKAIFIGIIIYLIIQIISIVLLMIGIKERNISYVFPYVCINFMMVVSLIVCGISHVALSLIMPGFTPMGIICIILFNGFILSIQTYIYIVVYSFYCELIQEKYMVGLSHTEDKGEIYREKLGYHV